jgi:predicted GNAT family N-acyltransferase
MLSDGHIGRMAVLKSWRSQGVGSAILQTMLNIARQQGYPCVTLDAQTHAIPFYQRFGFEVSSDEFMDAGIPHKQMRLNFSET